MSLFKQDPLRELVYHTNKALEDFKKSAYARKKGRRVHSDIVSPSFLVLLIRPTMPCLCIQFRKYYSPEMAPHKPMQGIVVKHPEGKHIYTLVMETFETNKHTYFRLYGHKGQIFHEMNHTVRAMWALTSLAIRESNSTEYKLAHEFDIFPKSGGHYDLEKIRP